MTGHWMLTGTIGKKPTTHDVEPPEPDKTLK
jgi:hypothetical protein